MITLYAEARVGGQVVSAQLMIVDEAWESGPELRESLERSIRNKLMDEIFKRWKPVVEVRR